MDGRKYFLYKNIFFAYNVLIIKNKIYLCIFLKPCKPSKYKAYRRYWLMSYTKDIKNIGKKLDFNYVG